MAKEYSYRTPYGLPVRYTLESDTHIENEFLFGVYERLFTGHQKPAVENYFEKVVDLRFPNHINTDVLKEKPHYAKLSHDQKTAYVCYMFLELGMTTDLIPKTDFHPRDYIFYSLINKRFTGFILLPLFYLISVFSMFIGYRIVNGKIAPKLSGELLWVLRYETMKSDCLLGILALPLKYIIRYGAMMRFGSVKGMVFAYFYDDIRHPILKNWDYKL